MRRIPGRTSSSHVPTGNTADAVAARARGPREVAIRSVARGVAAFRFATTAGDLRRNPPNCGAPRPNPRGTTPANADLAVRTSRALIAALSVAFVARAPGSAHALDPVASFRYLVTGNGHGFQVFDVDANAIKQYLERPYRYLRASPSNPDGEGIVRRNLAFDTYFGVRVGGQAAWLSTRDPSEVGYVDQTNVIRSVVTLNGVRTETFYVSPFGFERNAMVMLLRVENTSGSAQPVTAYSIHNFKLGSAPNPDDPGANGEQINYDAASRTATETGPGGGTMVYAPIGGVDVSSCAADVYATVAGGGDPAPLASCTGTDRVNAFGKSLGSLAPGATAWWGVAVLFDDGNGAAARDAWTAFLADRPPEQLYTDTLAEWDAWRTAPPPGLSADELAVWRQSEAVLRMGQVREEFQNSPRRKGRGMILASLPPGGWHTGWVRDATYALDALARTGHHAEAKMGLDFFLDSDANKYGSFLNDVDYRVSTVRYFGDGEEEADYSGAPTRNIEIDGWGLFLWAARAYVDASGDVGWLDSTTQKGDVVYDAIKNGVAEALAANMEPSGMAIADASIWEVHWGNRQHFLYTTAAAARGFCDMATLARRAGRDEDVQRYKDLSANAVAAIRGVFYDSQKVLAGSLEKLASGSNYRDGASVEVFTWSLLAPDDPIATATLGAFSYLQTPAGGYKRVEGSNDQYDTDEWILIDLRASNAFRRNGDVAKADQLLGWVSGQASANYDLLPELYNTRTSSGQIGAYSGSIPMVGYGAGAYQMTLLDRAGMYEYVDCGDLDLGEYPDAGMGPPGPSNEGNGEDRTGVACVCSSSAPVPYGTGLLFLGVFLLIRRRR
jgi:GH15 family glucan-1,4-alpha-glucosidase